MFFLVECNIPPVITGILAQVYKIILIVVPIGIVLFGSIDFVKAIVSKDQDTISKSTKTFITRIITGALTFFVLTIVTWLFRVIIGNVQDSSSALNCALQILGGNSSYTSSSGSNNLGPTLDKISFGANCNAECNNYYQTNSCVQACASYCRSGQVTFNKNDNPCNP